MKRRRHRGEEIIKKLRAIGEELAAGKRVEGGSRGKMVGPGRRKEAVVYLCKRLLFSERRACKRFFAVFDGISSAEVSVNIIPQRRGGGNYESSFVAITDAKQRPGKQKPKR